ncbi:MAG: DNA-processing protein DprA [Silicimonas sp.]|nr:DNA-processing protein DprA [Silicimonas sp.]NNL34621.1 DNA-protecting protein DprA [Silicimonas sp.]
MAKDLSPSTHPLTPPLTEEVWLSWLRLLRSRRVGVSTFFRLLNQYGSAEAALDALPGIAAEAGVGNYRVCDVKSVRDEWNRARLAGARPIAFGAPDYPARLAEIPDPPPILWSLGDPDLLARPVVALVGARNASSLGTRMARKLAGELGEAGYVVVSGLARGVDTAAHLAALETGTIAVLAGGVDVVYPAENAVLAQEIQDKGLRISERPVGTVAQARDFPRRNRIVSGVAQAVIVIEAAAKSGSLITARTALDQGRDVMAVPGHPFDARAAGTNILIRDGATLVRRASDVIEALATPEPVAKPAPETASVRADAARPDTQELHRRILDRLGPSPIPEDLLIRDIGISAARASAEIATLEIEGMIRRDPGGLLSCVATGRSD